MSREIYNPRPYQKIIAQYLDENSRCGIWAGMGLGKTASTLTMLANRYMLGELTKPTLILAPLRVVNSVWPQECRKWEHLSGLHVQPITGTPKARAMALRSDAPIYAINYENLPWLVEHLQGRWPFEIVIADESTKLKSFRTKQGGSRARALAGVAHTKIKEFKLLTGTPAPNGLTDLWGQTWMLDKGDRLGKTYSAYTNRWFSTDYMGWNMKALPHSEAEIHNKLADIHLSIAAKDYFDLAEPIVNDIVVTLPDKIHTYYKEMENKFFIDIGTHEINAVNAAVLSQKLLQISNGCVYVDDAHIKFKELHDAKIQALESVVNEAAGAPILIAYNYKFDKERILKHFKQARVLNNDPSTIEDWNAGKIPILLSHPASAGHGLNLQDGGNIIVFFGVDWNLENRMQIIERIGPVRQLQAGYDRPVFIHNILSDVSIDHMVMERIEGKRSVQDILLDAMNRR